MAPTYDAQHETMHLLGKPEGLYNSKQSLMRRLEA